MQPLPLFIWIKESETARRPFSPDLVQQFNSKRAQFDLILIIPTNRNRLLWLFHPWTIGLVSGCSTPDAIPKPPRWLACCIFCLHVFVFVYVFVFAFPPTFPEQSLECPKASKMTRLLALCLVQPILRCPCHVMSKDYHRQDYFLGKCHGQWKLLLLIVALNAIIVSGCLSI